MNWLRKLQRVYNIETDLDRLIIENQYLSRQLRDIQTSLNVITPGLSRIITKLDPKYTESEFSPERQAESDAIGEEVLKRLEAEAKARAPYNE